VTLDLAPFGSTVAPLVEPSAVVMTPLPGGQPSRGAIVVRNRARTVIRVNARIEGDSSPLSITNQGELNVPAGGALQLNLAADPARLPTAVSTATVQVQNSADGIVRTVEVLMLPRSTPFAAGLDGPPREITAVCPPGGLSIASLRTPQGFIVEGGAGT
jgi:hypothetical protein